MDGCGKRLPRNQWSAPVHSFIPASQYVADVEGYIFKYPNLQPYNKPLDECRSKWIYPDGANNSAYAPVATSELDPNGLITVNRMSADDYP